MIAFDMLSDGLFAAVAAIGFGAISDPPMRAFPVIALLAAVGHALRFALMQWGVDIASGIVVRLGDDRRGQPAAGRPHPLPDDGPVHSGAAADDSRACTPTRRSFR